MAFATGHTPPTGFVAGQLRDGASLGLVDATIGQPYKFGFTARYYKNQLFIIGTRYASTDTTGKTPVGDGGVVSPEWIRGVAGNALPNKIQFLTDLAAISATKAQMAAAGITDGQNFPTNPTGDLIPFEQTADGLVKAYVSATDQAKAAADAQKTQTNLLTTLTNAIVPNAATGGTGTTTGTSGAAASGMSMTVKIIIGVVVVTVVGGIIYAVTRKKKGGSKK